jgi:D-aspartate ligase
MVKILTLGSDMNVYYMSRCYHELYNENANALGEIPYRFTDGTNIINLSYNKELKNKDKFADILIDYYKKNLNGEKVLLVPCHDVYVRLVVENRKKLEKYYTFNCPSQEIMDSFLVKEKFYETYKDSELEFPNTYFYDVKEELKMPKNFRYPVILKPGDGLLYYRHHFNGQAKVYRLNNLEEVKKVIKQIKDSGYDGNLIIQEYIEGDDTNLFDAVFYVNTKGKCELATFAQIGLQEHGPTALGNCTVLINNYNQYGNTMKEVEKMKNFLENIGYRGFAEFDLKYDPKDKKFKVLEINPRQARSSYYLCACGYNLVKYLIEDLFENKQHEYKFIDKKLLLSMVPKKVIKTEIKNEEYRKEALKLYKEHVDPLNYKKDTGLKHRIYLLLRKIQYIRKYKKYKW